jgi:uncharacterized membrane protein
VRTPGLLLGIGLGAFLDGIVFHQILQWHHVTSDARERQASPTVEVLGGRVDPHVLADGIFHAAAWVVVAVGIHALWRTRDAARSGRSLLGWMVAGFGAFNVVEGTLNHVLLGVHHVREDTLHTSTYDLTFLVASAALCAVGLALARTPPLHAR